MDPAAIIDTPGLLRWDTDVLGTLIVDWPAMIAGVRRPPDVHLLDAFVRDRILGCEEGDEFLIERWLSPWPETIVIADPLPACQLCEADGLRRNARYDAPCTTEPGRPCAYMCESHFDKFGLGRLGQGLGQYLIPWDEVSNEFRVGFAEARAWWAQRGVPGSPWWPWEPTSRTTTSSIDVTASSDDSWRSSWPGASRMLERRRRPVLR